jgi:hypothetical protein
MARSQVEAMVQRLELVRREDLDAALEVARRAREEAEALSVRVAALEAKLGGGASPAVAPAPATPPILEPVAEAPAPAAPAPATEGPGSGSPASFTAAGTPVEPAPGGAASGNSSPTS